MGPKKKDPVFDAEEMWRKVIEDAPLDEENWSVKAILIEAAGSDQDKIYLSKFETYAAEEKRFVIKNICKTETVFMINQLGSEKKVKDENLRVFEEGNAYLKDKKDIPPDVYALIIKHLILKMKEEYLFIKGQKLEVQDGMRKESATMVDKAEVKGVVSGVHAPGADLQDKDPRSIEGKKFNTALRVRGEEWRDKVYVDDYPLDGPNLYVAITGFAEPFLPGSLVRIGIPLTAVVQIRIDATSQQIPSSLSRVTKRVQSQTEFVGDFWKTLQFLRVQEESAGDFNNTAFIIFTPPYWESSDLSGEADRIYDELCSLMYDIQDLSRQHVHYLENMDIINVSVIKDNEDYNKYYHKLIDDIPLESVTIYSVLDSILNAACRNVNLDDTSRSSLSTTATLNPFTSSNSKQEKSENLVKDIFKTLCKTESNKKQYRLTCGEEYENYKDPIIIKYGDIAKYNTFQLGNINLDQIVFYSLHGMPVHNLWLMQDRPSGELEAKVNFHVNVLLSCFVREELETSELNRLLHMLACRKLYNNRSSLKKRHMPPTTVTDFKKVYLKRSILAEPLPTCPSMNNLSHNFSSMTKTANASDMSYADEGNPEVQRIKYLFDCPDISELVSAAEIANNQPITHVIDDFEFFEDFAGICALQIMCQAFNKFNCVDYKYCEVTDCFILMFFNSHDKDGISRDEWRCHLCTPVCLQDFFDYILEEHYDWIQKEEKLYDENLLLKAQSVSKDEIDPSVLLSCIEDSDVDTDLLMEGSLKHQELLEVAEANLDSVESIDALLTRKDINPSIIIQDKTSKKTKSPATISSKSVRQSSDAPPTDSLESVEILPKPFLGYNLGDRRVEVFGKDATYFSKDGTKVSSLYSLIIPLNLEYIHLSIVTGNSHNEFSIHKALGEFVTPDISDSCQSFRITSKDLVMMNIQKRNYTAPRILTKSSAVNYVERKSQPKSVTSAKLSMLPLECESRHFHSLYLTWPNGMITETVHDNNSSKLSHIKQFYVCQMPDLKEVMRCISLNGEVIVFKDTGDIEVLMPDGSYINIVKYHKTVVIPRGLEEEFEDSSYKPKKTKNRSVKSSKISTKTSKTISLDDEKVSDDKNPEYELIIDEFEIIETNGFRKRYVNDVPISIEKLLIRTATDYCVGELFSRRMDGTNILINKDGVLIATFPNNTRIITYYVIDDDEVYPEWTDEEKEYFDLLQPDMETVNSKSTSSRRSYNDSDSLVSKKMEEDATEKERKDGYISIHLVYSIEHLNFSTVTVNKFTENISIESPNESTVVINRNNHYNITLDKVTTANFDGESLNISYEACPECKAYTVCNIRIMQPEGSLLSRDNNWVKVKDSFCKTVVINDEGSITIEEDSSTTDIVQSDKMSPDAPILSNLGSAYASIHQDNKVKAEDEVKFYNAQDGLSDAKPQAPLTPHVKCRDMYLAKAIRFFILKRDLSCSELIHRQLVEEYSRECRWQPWCSVNEHDTFGDYRRLISIITPVHLTESEKWYMNSKLSDKPKFLAYKDLKTDTGKGFYEWMRPYKRFEPTPIKPETVLPPRLPRAYVLRNLEQQWVEAERERLKGAKELLEAILRYRNIMETDSENLLQNSILDPRSEEERRVDDLIQNLAHVVGSENLQRAAQRCVSQDLLSHWRIACEASQFAVASYYRRLNNKTYEELRSRLADHIHRTAKATITTKAPLSPSVDQYVEVEQFGEELTTASNEEENQEHLIRQFNEMEEMSPKLQQYWRRRAEELKEEEFYKYLLREGNVPPYFRNVLGGAIWWEMNYTAGEAVAKSERRHTKCVCADNVAGNDGEGYTLPGTFQ